MWTHLLIHEPPEHFADGVAENDFHHPAADKGLVVGVQAALAGEGVGGPLPC